MGGTSSVALAVSLAGEVMTGLLSKVPVDSAGAEVVESAETMMEEVEPSDTTVEVEVVVVMEEGATAAVLG